jgi:hypothetical protein
LAETRIGSAAGWSFVTATVNEGCPFVAAATTSKGCRRAAAENRTATMRPITATPVAASASLGDFLEALIDRAVRIVQVFIRICDMT